MASRRWPRGVPLPRGIARFNRRHTNRFIEPLVRRSAGFALVHHVGRRSGAPYRTPVNVFDAPHDVVLVALTYGPQADWVQNVLAGGGAIERVGSTCEIFAATLVGRDEAWEYLPKLVRLALRMLTVRDFCHLHLVPAAPSPSAPD